MTLKHSTYEAMFLFDPGMATQWETIEKEISRIMQRANADVIGIKKWDERRLAYEIDHRKRGCYALTYFRAPHTGIGGIERDVHLSEMILRVLVLRSLLTEDQLAMFGREAAEQSAFLRSGAAQAAAPGVDRPLGQEAAPEAAQAGVAVAVADVPADEPAAAPEPEQEISRAESEALWGDSDESAGGRK
jgi:small subunit ribosomal protein S6